MKRMILMLAAASIAFSQCDPATKSTIDQGLIPPNACSSERQTPSPKYRFARIYIEPQEGFEVDLSKALAKKQVPLSVAQKKDEAQFRLVGGSKAHGFAGYGYSNATVQLIDNETQQVVWTHDVRKYFIYGAQRSEAEQIAKDLKAFINAHPNEFEVSK